MTAGRRRWINQLLTLALLALDVTPSRSQPPADLFGRLLCAHELTRMRPLAPIPVGCEIVDCCPGCPAHEAVDWRIRLAGDAAVSVTLEFENLPEAVRRQLRIEGTARWLDAHRLGVTRGEAFLRGFPRTFIGRPAVAVPRVTAGTAESKTILAATSETVTVAEPGASAADRRRIDFSVQQLVGPVIVNEVRVRRDLVNCRPVQPPRPDVIRLRNNVNNDNAVILLDARRNPTGPCAPPSHVNDEVWRGGGDVTVGNVLAPQSCSSDVVVFSQSSAMQLLENVSVWTGATGDRLDVDLAPRWQAPVTIWVVQGPFTTAAGDGTGDHAAANVQRADDLYRSMNCGLNVPGTITDATANPQAPGLLRRRCSDAGSLRTLIGFTPGRLNVYYIAEVLREGQDTLVRGATCGLVLPSPTPDDRNTILVSTAYMDGESLAHELGHGFSLRDRNAAANPGDPAYLPATNVMASGGLTRDSLTEGQCFRVNVSPDSALNRNGVRGGPTRSCPDAVASATCPALSLDPDPNN